MRRSSEFAVTEAVVPDLELPVEPDFRPLPRRVPLDVMIQRNEELRKMFPQSIPTEEERLASKVHEEFVL